MDLFTEPNSLADFGQAPTPPAGSQIVKIEIKNEEHEGYFDRIKDRYVWFPMHDISFIGNIQQPMSFQTLYRGRTAWIQPVAYKGVDNSIEAFDQRGEDELPLKTFALTPFAQCVYLYLNYATKGMRVFEHLKGAQPELVSHLESVILPEVPTDLLSLGKYLTEVSPSNIENAGFDRETYELASQTLASMISGVNDAIRYCRELIAESENEILTRTNKGFGKSHLDSRDKYAYLMIRKPIPKESTIDESPERRTNELLEALVNRLKPEGVNTAPVETDTNELAALREELAETQRQFRILLSKFNSQDTEGKPMVEDTETAAPEAVQEDLKTRLHKSSKKK